MTHRIAFAPRTRLASACLAWLGMAVVLPAWSLDLRQAYEAAYENDATIRAARAGAACPAWRSARWARPCTTC